MISVKLFLGLLIPFVGGYSVVCLLRKDERIPFSLIMGVSWGCGVGILAQWMLLVGGVLQISYNFYIIAFPVLGIAIVASLIGGVKFYTFYKRISSVGSLWQKVKDIVSQLTLFEKYFLILMVFYIAYYTVFVFWRALSIPIYSWDAVATSSFKAKVFFYEGTLAHLRSLPHSGYPIHVPLVETWIAYSLGGWHEQWIKIIFPVFFISYLFLQYSFMKVFTNWKWALGGVALIISAKIFTSFATVALRDFTMMYYNCGALMLLLLWHKKNRAVYFILAALFSGLTATTKLEGVGYLVIHVFVALFLSFKLKHIIVKTRVKQFLGFTALSLGIWFFYFLFKLSLGISSSGRFDLIVGIERLGFVPSILLTFSKLVLFTGHWHVLWFIFLLSLVHLVRKDVLFEAKFSSFVLLLFLAQYFLVALVTPNYISIAGRESIDVLPRVFFHFSPVVVWVILLLNYIPPRNT